MTTFRSVLLFHITAGTVGLVLGPIAMTALKGPIIAWVNVQVGPGRRPKLAPTIR
jgi:hypothetical protein